MLLSENVYCVAFTFKNTEKVEQRICIKFCIKFEYSSVENIQMIQKAIAMDNWLLAASSQQHSYSCIMPHAELFGEISNHPVTQPCYSPDLVPCDFWLFQKPKSPLKSKRFQIIDEIQRNMKKKDGGKIGGSRVHFPLHLGETPSQSTEEQSEHPTVPQHL